MSLAQPQPQHRNTQHRNTQLPELVINISMTAVITNLTDYWWLQNFWQKIGYLRNWSKMYAELCYCLRKSPPTWLKMVLIIND